jgi:hypothetical protein
LSIIRFVEKDQLKIISEKYINTAKACFIMNQDEKISTTIKIVGTIVKKDDDKNSVQKRLFEGISKSQQELLII